VVNKVSPNTTLTKAAYQAVRVSGAQGQRLAVALAQANNDANSADTIGLVTETINANQEGFIMTVGQLENINTTGSLQGETWADGDVLYLSPTTAGAITKVKPTGNGHIVVIGYVEYAHQNNGKIYVKVMNGWELDELHDVAIVSPANNEALIYESATSLWKNKTIATALGYTPISGSGTSGQVAYWNGTSSQTGSSTFLWNAASSLLRINGGIGVNRDAFGGRALDATGGGIRLTGSTSGTFEINGSNSSGSVSTVGGIAGINITDTSNARLSITGNSYNYEIQANADLLKIRDVTAGNIDRFIVHKTGNVAIGSSLTDGGQRLQVMGNAYIKGSGTTNATHALTIEDSAGTNLFRLSNDGTIILKNYTGGFGAIIYGNATTGLLIEQTIGLAGTHIATNYFCSFSNTSGTSSHLSLGGNFNPTSGTGVNNSINISRVVNQTGGANGITRGLYVNPTLTAAADWRSIEWSNNSGWGLYGAGTANNYLAGKLVIGTTTVSTFALDVNGTARVSGNMDFGTTAAASTITLPQTSGWTDFIVTNNATASTGIRFRNTAGTRVITIGGSNMDLSVVNGNLSAGTATIGNLSLGSISSSTIRGFNTATLDLNGDNVLLYSRTGTASPVRILSGSSSATSKGTVYISDYSNVAGTINASAQLQVDSTVQGFLPPRMTTTQKNAIGSPAAGLMVFDTTLAKLCVYSGTSWETITSL